MASLFIATDKVLPYGGADQLTADIRRCVTGQAVAHVSPEELTAVEFGYTQPVSIKIPGNQGGFGGAGQLGEVRDPPTGVVAGNKDGFGGEAQPACRAQAKAWRNVARILL